MFSYPRCSHIPGVLISQVFSYPRCSHIPGVPISQVFSYPKCSSLRFQQPENATQVISSRSHLVNSWIIRDALKTVCSSHHPYTEDKRQRGSSSIHKPPAAFSVAQCTRYYKSELNKTNPRTFINVIGQIVSNLIILLTLEGFPPR